MNDEEAIKAARRLQILRALSIRPHHTATPGSLLSELEATGFPVTLTKLMIEAAFLADLSLVTTPATGYLALTDDGLSVARGLVKLPGIGQAALGEK